MKITRLKHAFLLTTLITTLYTSAQNTMASHEFVDLGLPSGLLWATCNVGANVPPAYGNYYAWGEVNTKNDYSSDTYKYCNPTNTWPNEHGAEIPYLTKYCTNINYGDNDFIDLKTTLETYDDVASIKWGGTWRIPTDEEWTELRENCTWTWFYDYGDTGVSGYKVIGENGNYIFLPAAGFRDGYELRDARGYGEYWSSSLNATRPSHANAVLFSKFGVYHLDANRDSGLPVRPVCK